MQKLVFTFKEPGRSGTDWKAILKQINKKLSSMKLADLELEDFSGYQVTVKNYSKNEQITQISYGYYFTKCVFLCTPEDAGASHCYQLDVTAVPHEEEMDGKEFSRHWHEEHPDRTMHTMLCYQFRDALVYFVTHHEKPRSGNVLRLTDHNETGF